MSQRIASVAALAALAWASAAGHPSAEALDSPSDSILLVGSGNNNGNFNSGSGNGNFNSGNGNGNFNSGNNNGNGNCTNNNGNRRADSGNGNGCAPAQARNNGIGRAGGGQSGMSGADDDARGLISIILQSLTGSIDPN